MKGFMVVNRLNDIRFIDTDKEFARHVNEQAQETGLPIDGDIYTLDPNIVMQQFSPLIMSQWFMIDHSHNPCTAITCENNFLFVFKQFGEFLVIAINGDGTETEEFLRRKTLVFIRLAGFLLGPVIDEIGSPHFISKQERWKELRHIMSTWIYLANNDQSFLVEAVEKLHVNQMVNEQCIEMLHAAVTKLQESGERSTQHALLLVNSKLLSLYSSQNAQELQSSDILCISLLARSLFPTHEKLEDLFSYTSRDTADKTLSEARSPATVKLEPPQRDRYESAVEGLTDTENEEFFIASEWIPGSSVSKEPLLDTLPNVVGQPDSSQEASSDSKNTASTDASCNDSSERPRSLTCSDIDTGVRRGDGVEDSMGRGRSLSLHDSARRKDPYLCGERSSSESILHSHESGPEKAEREEEEEDTKEKEDGTAYIRRSVFLVSSICKYMPYQMHCIRIYPGTLAVFLTGSPKQTQAQRLVLLMNLFKDLINGHRDVSMRAQGQTVYDWIHRQMTMMLMALKKLKGPMTKLFQEVKAKLESDELISGITAYFEKGTITEIPQSLERSLRFLHIKVTEIFKYLYLLPRPPTPQLSAAIATIIAMATKQLDDYRHYLTVKAQRNIVMTTYINDFPGLIHFIYVNRQTNRMMAPALNITHADDKTDYDATQLLKDNIWSMTSWMQQKIHQGYTSVIAREGDYQYSYFVWFENCKGEPEVIQKPFRGDCTAPPPGTLTGNFYRYLTHKCFPDAVPNAVHCNELIMMHVGLATSQYIAGHCRQLASKLYETSGSLLSSVPML